MGLTGGVKSIGCQDKFHHIVKKNVIGSARIARLCLANDVTSLLMSKARRTAIYGICLRL